MDLMTITNLNAYIKGLELKTTWDLKQQAGKPTAKGASLDEWLDTSQIQSMAGSASHGDEKLTAIHTKLDAGGTLTPEERDYLKSKDPEAYRELVAEERAQRAYEQALRRCKTQDEVRRLQTSHINNSLMVVRSVEHNSHIPLQKKLEIAMREKRRVDDVAASTQAFIRRGDYEKLPTDAEVTEVQLEQHQPPQSAEETESLFPQHSAESPSTSETDTAEERAQIAPVQEEVDPKTLDRVRRAQARSAYLVIDHSELHPTFPPALDQSV